MSETHKLALRFCSEIVLGGNGNATGVEVRSFIVHCTVYAAGNWFLIAAFRSPIGSLVAPREKVRISALDIVT